MRGDSGDQHLFLRHIARGTGRPLVCLHGFMGSSRDWEFLAGELPGRAIWGVDLPGHGASIGLSGSAYSVRGAAALVSASLRRMGSVDYDLLGYSMGGRVALALAISRPTEVHSLLLESAGLGLQGDDDRHRRARLDDDRAAALRSGPLKPFLDAWYELPVFSSLSPLMREERIAHASRNDRDELARAVAGMSPGRQEPMLDDLPDLDVPVTYVSGALDRPYVATGDLVAERAPRVEHVTVEGAGHTVHLERSGEFLDIIRSHLTRADSWHR
jgi:2-succinyl-6-hydroxy-2,4-cyclohexadiene-1-carboxylate synthase